MPIMTAILSQQFWQMNDYTDQHKAIQNTLAMVKVIPKSTLSGILNKKEKRMNKDLFTLNLM